VESLTTRWKESKLLGQIWSKQSYLAPLSNSNDSREPRNPNQRLALNYRQSQLRVLREALASNFQYVQQSISSNCICSHTKPAPESSEKANFISLECAFEWLRRNYRCEYDAVMKFIAEDQEEPLPLNWSIIIDEWDRTYWIVWIFLVWMLWYRDVKEFEHTCQNDLYGWQSKWFS
jgi:protein-histidine N-methyltransferase